MRPLDPRLLPHLAPARAPLAGAVVASVVSAGAVITQAFAVSALVTSLFHGLPWLPGGAGSLGAPATLLAAATVVRSLAGWAVDLCSASASTVVTTTLRRRVLGAALAPGGQVLSHRRSGELALLTTRGVASVDPYLTRYLPALVLAAVLPPLTVLVIATQDPLSALVVLATLPLVPVFAILVGMATRDRADSQWRVLAALSGHFVDVMQGLPTLVAHRRATHQAASIRGITDRYRQATNETLKLAFASSGVLELVATLSVALVAVEVGLRLASSSLGLGTALVVLLLAPEAYWPLRRVGAEFHAAAEGTATFEAATTLLDSVPARGAGAAAEPRGPVELGAGIDLVDLTVGYPDRPEPVLRGLTAHIPGRGLTAVTGPSGCGKSTLLAALTGDLPLQAGSVRVGPTALDEVPPELWQSSLAWVPQRPWIMAATVRDNVLLGRPGAADAQVWAALERVSLAHLVATLPGGLDEPVDEDGASLSAGQRARLALARTVVAERPLVLLDEPTAHLDELTEKVIADTLLWLSERSAVVVVAHRPRIAALADHVVELPALPVPATRRPGPQAASPTEPSRVAADPRPPVAPVAAPATKPSATTAAAPWRRWDPSPRARLALAALLGALAAAAGVALTATAGWLIARAAEHPPVLTLMVAIVAVRTFGLARPALRYAERLVSHDVALRLLAERRASVYDMLVPLVPGRLGPQRGDVLASVVDDVDALVDTYLRVRSPLATSLIVSAMAVGFSALVLPAAGLVALLVLAVGGAAAYGLSRAGVTRAERGYVTSRAALSAAVVQTLQGARDLVLWQAAERALDRVDAAGAAVCRAATGSARAVATGRALAVLVSGLGVVAMARVGEAGLAHGTLSRPMLALLVLLPLALLEVVAPLADAGALSVRTRAADDRLARLASLEPAVRDPARPLSRPTDATVALEAVGAGWGADPAFTDVTVTLGPGARVGVVGPSGCGKSTLAAVLLRFLDPALGVHRLGGVDARDLRLDDVRQVTGLVDDDPHIFSSTLAENLRLARPEAEDAALEAALRAAQLGPWLDGLPDGLHTRVGDGYAHVSGGERARIGLARSLLADQPVLVLDEPTAHLDSGTARAVTEDLLAASSGRTLVWITHGSIGLDQMDRVLDLGASPAPVLPAAEAGLGS